MAERTGGAPTHLLFAHEILYPHVVTSQRDLTVDMLARV